MCAQEYMSMLQYFHKMFIQSIYMCLKLCIFQKMAHMQVVDPWECVQAARIQKGWLVGCEQRMQTVTFNSTING